jgi:N-acetylneuraminate synthase
MKPLICAELSANHLGDCRRALHIVDAAADAGADLFKVQTWSPGTMCVSDYVMPSGLWFGQRLRNLYSAAFLPWEWHRPIFELARRRGMIPFSAAFDRESVDFLEGLGVDRHKVASFELTDLPLIRYMASKRKPMIMSTGMATPDEIDQAMTAAEQGGCPEITLAHCTSSYPAGIEQADLATMVFRDYAKMGLSDHTLGHTVAVAATALGATYIEKHLTLRRADGGLDAAFSMEPHEFKVMASECQRAALAIGRVRTGPVPGEHPEMRRSLWVVRDVARGERLVLGENVRTARPALGLPCDTPLEAEGRSAARDLRAGEPLTRECLS